MKIVVDAMGGDQAPAVVVAGAVAETRERGTPIILVGQEARVRAELAKHGDVSKLPIEALMLSHRCTLIGAVSAATAAVLNVPLIRPETTTTMTSSAPSAAACS